MSDLFGDMMSTAAALESSEAASAAKQARNAARETLESSGHNPFLIFDVREFDTIPGNGFFGSLFGGKSKLQTTGTKVSIKKTDISHLAEEKDDFGTTYTKVYLEEGSTLNEDYGTSYLYVASDMEALQAYINKQ